MRKEIKARAKTQVTRTHKIVSRVLNCVLVMCICGMLFFVFKISSEMMSAKESNAVFGDIQEQHVQEYDPAEKVDGVEKTPDVVNAITVDWDSFDGTEIAAWFQMDDISYPIMQHTDNDYYLHHLPDGRWSSSGSLFLLAENNPFLTDNSSFVYGHNMLNGTMFSKLHRYTDIDSADKEFYIYLPDGTRHVYRFFAVEFVDASSDFYTWSFGSDDTFMAWQQRLLDGALFDTGYKADLGHKFVTLSTCARYAGYNKRLIVSGVEDRVETLQAPASWYSEYLEKYETIRDAWSDRSDAITAGLSEWQNGYRSEVWQLMPEGSE